MTDLHTTGVRPAVAAVEDTADQKGVAAAVTGTEILPGLSDHSWTVEQGQAADQTVDQAEEQHVEQAVVATVADQTGDQVDGHHVEQAAVATDAGHHKEYAVMAQPLELQKESGGCTVEGNPD